MGGTRSLYVKSIVLSYFLTEAGIILNAKHKLTNNGSALDITFSRIEQNTVEARDLVIKWSFFDLIQV